MSKRTRTLLFSGIAVVVLAALLTVLLLLPPPDTDIDQPEPEDTSVTLVDKSTEEDEKAITPQKVAVTYAGETYTLITDDDNNLIVEKYAALPHSSVQLTYLTDEVTVIKADRLVAETPEDPKVFGFGGDKSTAVSVEYSDGSTFAFELGDTAPSGEGRYLREVGKSAVYLYDETAASTFMVPSKDYLSKSPIILPSAESTEEAAADETVIRDAELSGSIRPEPIFLQVAPDAALSTGSSVAGYLIQRPYYRSVRAESEMMTTAAYTFTASDVAAVYPTAVQLAEYGFNNPYSQCLFHLSVRHTATTDEKDQDGNNVLEYSYYNTLEYTVKLGNKTEDGRRYAVVYLDDELLPIVYLVEESAVVWANLQYDDIADTLLFYIYITNVDTMTFTYKGEKKVFDLQHVEDAEKDEENLFVYVDGKAYDTQSFREMYQVLTGLYRSAAAEKAPSGKPIFTLDIDTFKDTVRGAKIEIYEHTPSRYLIKHDTGEQYLVDARKVETMFDKYDEFLEKNK